MADPAPPPGFTLQQSAVPPPPPGFTVQGAMPPPPPGFSIQGAPAAARPAGATDIFGQIGQTFQDLIDPNHPQHDPNSLESGIIGATYNKPVQSLVGNWQSAVSSGLATQPVRTVMERLGVGRQPGESDASLHQRYNNAIIASRQQAQQQMQANTVGTGMDNTASLIDGVPRPTLGDRVERFGQQVLNTGASLAANPEYFLLPGMGIGGNAVTRVAAAAGGNALVGSASDAAAQGMDIASGVKKDFDVKQNLQSAVLSGVFGGALHGAIEVAPHVSNLFSTRGVDTTPPADPRPFQGQISPMTTDHIAMNAADHAQYQQLLKTGNVDDIKQFFQGRNGPQPSWSDVNTWVEHRDGPQPVAVNGQPGGPNPEMQPDFNYEQAYNDHAQQQYNEQNRQAVEDHVNQQMAGWKNAPNVEVVHSPNEIADPGVRDSVIKQDTDGNALGAFGSDGKVHIFSGRISDPDTANAVIFHEGLGHFGLSEVFQDRLNKMMTSLSNNNVSQFAKDVDARQTANPGESRALSAEEVLAERSQSGQMPKSWQNALSSTVRGFGRKMGLDLTYNDAEVNNVLAMAHDAVINGKSVRANGFRGASQDPNNKFMFTGPHAENFDPEKAFVPNDYHPRNEISDREARITNPSATRLGDVIHHPELFQNYPELRDLPVVHEDMPHGMHGYYDDGTDNPQIGKHIGIDDSAPDKKSVILHEIQHAIQDIEKYPDFVKAAKEGGTAQSNEYDYNNHPSEVEARAVEARQNMRQGVRERYAPPKFMRTDALGREPVDSEHLDDVDRLKADPRFWSDPEFRKNVIELGRTRFDPENAKTAETPVYRTETEARTAAGNKFITQSQLNRSRAGSGAYDADDIEGIAQHLHDNYTPNQVPYEQTRQDALKAGISPSSIKSLGERNPGELAARVARIGAAADYAAMKVGDILKRFDTPDWKPDDHINLAKAIAERNYLMERFRGEGNEVGRALNTLKVFKSYSNGNIADVLERLNEDGSGLAHLADPTNPNGVKFARELKQMLENGNPDGAQTKMSQVNKPYWEQYALTAHMNMMLSALSTHVKAPVDMSTGIARNVIEKAAAMPIGKVRQAFEAMTGRQVKPGVEAAELANHMFGIMKAISDGEVYRAAWNAVKTGQSSYVVGGKRTPTNFANTFGSQSNPRFGVNGDLPGNNIVGLVNKPTDLISAQDTFFRSVEINAQLLALGAREAAADLRSIGSNSGKKASMSDIMTLGHTKAMNPTPSMLKEAYDLTNRTLLLNDNPLNSFVNKFRTYRPGMNPAQRFGTFIANLLMPFIRVESNSLINRVVTRSPLGLLNYFNAASDLRAGGAKADIAMSKIVYGTVLLGMMWAAANPVKNYLTGDGPGNVDQYKEKIASGWRPDAVHEGNRYTTGGNQLGMSINPFDMHNKTAQMVASVRQAYEAGANGGQVANGLKLALGSLASNLVRQSWASDIDPTLSALTGQGEDAQSKVTSVVTRQAQSWVPNIFNQTAKVTDGIQRDTSGNGSIMDALHNSMSVAIPGARENLPIKYSVYGDPLQQGASLSGEHVPILGLSGNGTTQTSDPAEMELDRLNTSLPDIKSKLSASDASLLPNTLVTPVEHTIKLDDGTPKKLTPSEFEEYQRVAGKGTVETVRQDMNTPEWQAMSDRDKVLRVRTIQSDMKYQAREALFNHETSNNGG